MVIDYKLQKFQTTFVKVTNNFLISAPSGSRILQTITTTSFITVFLEEIPGATGWEIEYNNTISGESFVLTMPDDTPSNTFYVGL